MNELCYLLDYNIYFTESFHHLVQQEAMMIHEYPEEIIERIWTDDLICESFCIREQELILDFAGCIDACL